MCHQNATGPIPVSHNRRPEDPGLGSLELVVFLHGDVSVCCSPGVERSMCGSVPSACIDVSIDVGSIGTNGSLDWAYDFPPRQVRPFSTHVFDRLPDTAPHKCMPGSGPPSNGHKVPVKSSSMRSNGNDHGREDAPSDPNVDGQRRCHVPDATRGECPQDGRDLNSTPKCPKFKNIANVGCFSPTCHTQDPKSPKLRVL